MTAPLEVDVIQRREAAPGIVAFELAAPPEAAPLPAWEPGAHIDVLTPTGITRQYSLLDPCPGGANAAAASAARRWRIAVLREPASRGGSAWLVDQVQPGQRLRVAGPRNHFALEPGGAPALLVAGGIGITPLFAMAQHLGGGVAGGSGGEAGPGRDAGAEAAKPLRAFTLHYCARSRERMAFAAELLAAPWAERVRLHFDDGVPAQLFDAEAVLSAQSALTHLYVCGPAGFMDHVLGTARRLGWAESRLHREYFAAPAAAASSGSAGEASDTLGDGPFELQLGRGGRVVTVAASQSAADALLAAGISLTVSCEQGICGTCLTQVLAGDIEHRDLYLTDAEHAAGDRFTPCCSRARVQGGRLVLEWPLRAPA